MQYNFFIDKRPQRIAFIVNPDTITEENINDILTYNMRKWGGRYNPIIYSNGIDIDENELSFLKSYDPDIIKSFLKIQSPLLNIISRELTPFLVDDVITPRQTIYINDPGISYNENIVDKFKYVYFGEPYLPICVIDYQNIEKDLLYFLLRNFGFGQQSVVTRNLNKINNERSFNAFLNHLSEKDRILYPIQYSSMPNHEKASEYDYRDEVFTIIIGDKPQDIFYGWNRGITLLPYRRNKLNHIWLSTKILEKEANFSAIKNFLLKTIQNNTKSGDGIRVVSTSLPKEELKVYSDRLFKDPFILADCEKVTIQKPCLHEIDLSFYLERKTFETHKIQDITKEDIFINHNTLGIEAHTGGYYILDIYIKQFTEIDTCWGRQENLLLFPKRNEIACTICNSLNARINSVGVLSISISDSNPSVRVNIEKISNIFSILITNEYKPFFSEDARKNIDKKTYNAKESNAGKYLKGLITIFNGLDSAYAVMKERYWRNVFNRIIYRNPIKHKRLIEKTREEILSNIRTNKLNEKNVRWWVDRLLHYSKRFSINLQKGINYGDLEEMANNDIEEDKKKYGGKYIFDGESLKQEINELLKINVLHMGIESTCIFCGCKTWYPITELKQHVKCNGCGNTYSMKTEPNWTYKVNSLIERCYKDYNLEPVILVLGKINEDSRQCFLYNCSMDLIKKSDGAQVTDIDILCIQDGDFIIGEIKEKTELFTDKVIEGLREISIQIRPDTLLLAAYDNRGRENVPENVIKLKKDLKLHQINVLWFVFDKSLFDPSTMFAKYSDS